MFKLLFVVVLVIAFSMTETKTAEAQCVGGSCRSSYSGVTYHSSNYGYFPVVRSVVRAPISYLQRVQPVRRVITYPFRMRPLQGRVIRYQNSYILPYRTYSSCSNGSCR